MHRRESDRWVTPGVVIWFLILGTLIVLGVIGAVTFLTARGFDPKPVVELVAQLVTAVGALGGLVLQLVNRRTVTKVERNTGQSTTVVADLVDAVDAVRETVASGRLTSTMPPVRPPVPGREAAPGLWERDRPR